MRRTLIISLVLALAAAAPASASDASVEKAWDADDATYSKLGKQFRAGIRAWEKSGRRKPGRALRVLRKTRRTLKRTYGRVKAETSSSATGERAKKLALASMRDFGKQLRLDGRILRRLSAGKGASALIKRRGKLIRSARKRSKRARALFRQAETEAAAPPA